MPGAILFDLDGTLTDAKPGIVRSIQYALSEMGYAVPDPEALGWCVGPPLHRSFARLLNRDEPVEGHHCVEDSLIQQALTLYRQRYATLGMFESTLYPQVPDTLKALRVAGYRTFVATSKPQVYANQIISYFSISSLFDRVYGSEFDGTRSEKGDLIRYILQTENLSATTTVMIGDREHDIIGAKLNQVAAIGVTYGYGSLQELQAQGANWIVASPTELLQLFGLNLV
ncbi:HAD family hydrolase [Alkalinema sp. FACHB-956]|uniref:HAD family hydrolase n=1 Tax=Alkalinema sp. FACHB-956 TaxID=2692768 RepID=UPI001685FBF6|nr:HAD family hydrolase [Alkalinema sp. FACHB-956]MBD2329261.1 HAD family hydrolase [Alkalinema sp. FACHB-956]